MAPMVGQSVWILTVVYDNSYDRDTGERIDETFIEGVFSSVENAKRYIASDLNEAHSDDTLTWAPSPDIQDVLICKYGAHARYEIVRHEVE